MSWRPVATVAAFSILPLAVFLSENRDEAELGGTLLLFPLGLFAIGLAAVWAAGRRGGRVAAERAGVVVAVVFFLLFQYAAIGNAIAWAAVSVVAITVMVRLSRSELSWNWVLAVGVALTAVNVLQYVTYPAEGGELKAGAKAEPHAVAKQHAGKGGPDVYFFLLDGYGRADELRRVAGVDNAPFVRELRRRGFDVARDALTSYPMTLASVMTTLSLDYTLPAGSRPGRDTPYRRLEGDNVAAASLRRLGYDFVHATDYDKYTCEDFEDMCVDPKRRAGLVGTAERAFLEATPLAPALPAGLKVVGRRQSVLAPDGIVAEVQDRRDRGPVFVYAHLMTPHPPYRYDARCQVRTAFDGDLDAWGDPRGADGRRFADTVRCTNAALLRATDAITRHDPDALIFIQGDHGTAFDLDFRDKPLQSWSARELRQRFAILSAARLPERCADRRAPRTPVNTFRLALGCITGERVPSLPARQFTLGYEDGDRVEALPASRLRDDADGR